MRTIIGGSRSATLLDTANALSSCPWLFKISVVLSGTADGGDKYGEKLAAGLGLPVERYPADWNRYGLRAGFIRTDLMISKAEALLSVWDGFSKGTGYTIEQAKKAGLKVFVYRFGDYRE